MNNEDRIACPRCEGIGYLSAATATVGDMIARKRNAIGMTQQQLAAHVGCSRAQVANIESGRHDPPISRLRAFAEALACPMKDLVP